MQNNITTIGIIGGGQLGMMMTEAAHLLGYRVVVLDPTPGCPCGLIAEEQIVAAYDDEEKIEELCRKSDVVTYEFENVPYTSVKKWKSFYNIPQGELPLYYSQNRLREKNAAVQAGAITGKYVAINSCHDLVGGLDQLGYPSVLKTASGGYDGKGQVVLRSPEQLDQAMELAGNTECILEKFIPFDCEISVIVTRSPDGTMTTLPVTRNIHRENILFMSIAPAGVSEPVLKKAGDMARNMMINLGFVGTLAIEMFVVGEEVYFNEMAPRPHNSGHYSIEGCITGQFEQHIRSITGMPLGETTLKQPSVMVNYLGQHVAGIEELKKASLEEVYIHDYRKKEAKHNRKMGHVTFLGYTEEQVKEIVESYWNR